MAVFFYPPLDAPTIKNLLVIQQLVAEHSSYFLESEYSQEVEQNLLKLFKHTPSHTPSTPLDPEELDLEAETRTLYRDLKNAKPGPQDTSDAMAFYRTSTALLERLLTLKEKANNIKLMSDHNALVLTFMEEVLSPTQLEEFLKRLEAL